MQPEELCADDDQSAGSQTPAGLSLIYEIELTGIQ